MRKDIRKVVFERAKSNRTWASKTPRDKRVLLDDSGMQSNESANHRRTRKQKFRNSHFNAVLRFLNRNVGRPWSKVYSELCQHADARNLLGFEIRQYVSDCVAINCRLTGSTITHNSNPVHGLYVHPRTGRLMRML